MQRLSDKKFITIAEIVLNKFNCVKNYRISGRTVIADIITNSGKGTWQTVIEFTKSGKIKNIYFPHKGSLTPVNIAREIEDIINILRS